MCTCVNVYMTYIYALKNAKEKKLIVDELGRLSSVELVELSFI